jgi:hypothetical protein
MGQITPYRDSALQELKTEFAELERHAREVEEENAVLSSELWLEQNRDSVARMNQYFWASAFGASMGTLVVYGLLSILGM